MAEFRKKLDERMNDALRTSQNGTLPPFPSRPMMPKFCFGKDAVLYVFAGCTVQNYKLYIGQKFARELNPEERDELDIFAKQMASAMPAPNPLVKIILFNNFFSVTEYN
ncbi:unnamed protein product [Gongylonema pulchrum]|uniref:Pepsin-I3 domain-containing protein n=1 Tax=Gongylonema pulchrum TaxID=637853 RepID=A0A183DB73_9BILA|nr:unnamed protein product [Gongylonema pulchrum]